MNNNFSEVEKTFSKKFVYDSKPATEPEGFEAGDVLIYKGICVYKEPFNMYHYTYGYGIKFVQSWDDVPE